jgi:glycosyltransferase involved in cell wall biosynthesis
MSSNDNIIKISAVIITHNEEKNIARCISSVKKIADEVIVVDSFSTDSTVPIAKSLGANVISHEFNGYGEQKYFAEKLTSNPWILSLDADEEISVELGKSILLLKDKQPIWDAYKINILPNFCGKWIRHCGWYPQPKVRLWNKCKGATNNNTVHEEWLPVDKTVKIGRLRGDILHYSYPTISDYMRKLEQYSELKARAAVSEGKHITLLKIIVGPAWRFIVDFFLRAGFLDGYYGYIVCKNSAFYTFIKYIKIWVYNRDKKRMAKT